MHHMRKMIQLIEDQIQIIEHELLKELDEPPLLMWPDLSKAKNRFELDRMVKNFNEKMKKLPPEYIESHQEEIQEYQEDMQKAYDNLSSEDLKPLKDDAEINIFVQSRKRVTKTDSGGTTDTQTTQIIIGDHQAEVAGFNEGDRVKISNPVPTNPRVVKIERIGSSGAMGVKLFKSSDGKQLILSAANLLATETNREACKVIAVKPGSITIGLPTFLKIRALRNK